MFAVHLPMDEQLAFRAEAVYPKQIQSALWAGQTFGAPVPNRPGTGERRVLEKMPHVKNPLSVVALFAGLAEVSGTVALPFLGPEVQAVFVWFLMAFPTLLVLLFFATLNWNHTVLYAPSDFKDENNFTSLTKASPVAVEIKAQGELVEAVLEDGTPPSETGHPVPDKSGLTVADNSLTDEQPSRTSKIWEKRQIRNRTKLAVEMTISRLEAERNVEFLRNMSPASEPALVFDAVAFGSNGVTVVEVKYTVQGAYPGIIIDQILQRVELHSEDLLGEGKSPSALTLILVFVTGNDVTDDGMTQLTNRAYHLGRRYSFKLEVLTFKYNELVGIFG